MNVPSTPPIREPTTPCVCAARSDDVCKEGANVLLNVLIEYTGACTASTKLENSTIESFYANKMIKAVFKVHSYPSSMKVCRHYTAFCVQPG